MLNYLQSFISSLFFDNAFLGTAFASMLPIIEARGAIPLGLSTEFWSTPLSPLQVFFASLVGTSIMTLLLLLITYPLCTLFKRIKFVKCFIDKLECKVAKFKSKNSCLNGASPINTTNASKATQQGNNNNIKKYVFLCLFTALPIPLTGYYTACLIASFCQFDKIKAFIALVCGNLICISLMLFVSLIAGQYVSILFYLFLFIFIATIFYFAIDAFIKRRKNQKLNNLENGKF